MRLGIRARLILISLGLILCSDLVAYAYMRPRLEQILTDSIRADLSSRANLIVDQARQHGAPTSDLASWDALADELGDRADTWITFLTPDGTLIGDSELSLRSLQGRQLKSVADRALRLGRVTGQEGGSSGARVLYVEEPLVRGGEAIAIARVATPLTLVSTAVSDLQRTLTIASLLAFGSALVLASIVAHLVSRRARALTEVARRMADGDLSTRTEMMPDEDAFAEVGRALDRLAGSLSSTVDALRSERDRLSGILAGMQDGVLMLDRDGRVAVINPALREMLLLGPDVVGRLPLELIRHAELKELLDQSRTSGHSAAREIEVAGLKPRRLLVRAAPLGGVQGGVFAVFVDVTEMRRLESLRREFVANVSHELRTPVTAIRSAAETLQSVPSSEPQVAAGFVEIIDRNAARLHGLVEDLLDLSRIESRAIRLSVEPLDLRAVFEQAAGLFEERAEKKQLRLLVDVPPDLPQVRADRRALEHILTNLIDNAVKYCGAGAEVRLTAARVDGGVAVVIQDTGAGIEPRHLPRLFERFYRVDAGRSRELGGTGLGLSIVKHLVEAMGSTIEVESQVGRGTRFQFVLGAAAARSRLTQPSTASLH